MFAVASLVAPSVTIAQAVLHRPSHVVISIASGVIFLLVLLRITDLVREHEALTEANLRDRFEARLGSLVRNSSDVVSIVDADGVVLYISPAALRLLMDYHWPGNIRELQNFVERAMIVTTGDTLNIDARWMQPAANGIASDESLSNLAEVEHRTILDAIQRCGGRIYGSSGAAAALGLKPTTLYGKMRKLGIRNPARAE